MFHFTMTFSSAETPINGTQIKCIARLKSFNDTSSEFKRHNQHQTVHKIIKHWHSNNKPGHLIWWVMKLMWTNTPKKVHHCCLCSFLSFVFPILFHSTSNICCEQMAYLRNHQRFTMSTSDVLPVLNASASTSNKYYILEQFPQDKTAFSTSATLGLPE